MFYIGNVWEFVVGINVLVVSCVGDEYFLDIYEEVK